ncbi:MAG: hypothetical protein LLG05_13170, partial [Porphyromonadaceae bacterium]|nr:hypothetical protein [Porphyromonadaceae bacterium]
MKALFVPNYFYLHLPVFEIIIEKLNVIGVSSYVLKLPGNTKISADDIYNMDYFNKRGIAFIELPLNLVSSYKDKIVHQIHFLTCMYHNFRIIRAFIHASKPDFVIVGSDLGNLHIRFLLNACSKYNIPVVILYTCDVPLHEDGCNAGRMDIVDRLNKQSFLRAFLFRGNIPGAYFTDAQICVLSNENKDQLIKDGISKSRITVTGMPSKLSCSCRDETEILKEVGLKKVKDDHVVIFFTEHLQVLYGLDYLKELYSHLVEIIKNMPSNVHFIIKLHPLEPLDMELYIKNKFIHPHCKIIKSGIIEELIAISDLCIAHFSRVLISTALMRKRFLSINMLHDRERTFIQQSESNVLEIQSYEELENKIK